MEICWCCGRLYITVWSVPDELWERVTGKTDGSGLLCVECFAELALKKGIHVYWEGGEGKYPTESKQPGDGMEDSEDLKSSG